MKTISVIGLGNRGYEYMEFLKIFHKKKIKINAICDISMQALNDLKPIFDINNEMAFNNTIDFFNQGVLSDGLIISTQDRTHFEICKNAILTGYKYILLEKPVSPIMSEVLELKELASKYGAAIVVCHVLRYSNFFLKIKELIENKELGNLININHTENVGYFHFAHSYVRGNWHKEIESSNSMLAKCCHDIDLIYWWVNSKIKSVNGYGELKYFTKENFKDGMIDFCVNGCKYKKSCPYDAEYTYITVPFYKATFIKYNHRTMTGKLHNTKKDMYECIKNTNYGRCVYKMDNDVMEFETSSLVFENGVTAEMTLNAFSKKMFRSGHIKLTNGEIIYFDNTIIVNNLSLNKKKVYHPSNRLLKGHIEGDINIIKSFVNLLYGINNPNLTTIDETIESHKIIDGIERSRKDNNKKIEF